MLMVRNLIIGLLVTTILVAGFASTYIMWSSPREYYIAITIGVTEPHTSVLDFARDILGYIFSTPRAATDNATTPTVVTSPTTYKDIEDVWQFIEYANEHKDEINTKLHELASEMGVDLPSGSYAVFVQVVRPGGEAVYLTFHYSDGKFTGVDEGWSANEGETVVAKITHVKEEFLIKCFKLLMSGEYEELNDEAVHGYFAKSYIIEEVNF